jgi:hypothetical protein
MPGGLPSLTDIYDGISSFPTEGDYLLNPSDIINPGIYKKYDFAKSYIDGAYVCHTSSLTLFIDVTPGVSGHAYEFINSASFGENLGYYGRDDPRSYQYGKGKDWV